MKTETKYGYQKRIKDLEGQNDSLRCYKGVAISIFNMITDMVSEGKQISQAWIIKQYRDVMK